MRVRGVRLVAVAWVLLGINGLAEAQPPRTPYRPDAQELKASYERADGLRKSVTGRVTKTAISPHWFHENTRFWFREDGRQGVKTFILVDAEKGTRAPAFDHAKLAESLSKAAGAIYTADKPPFDFLTFIDGDKAIKFQAGGSEWRCDLETLACTKLGKSSEDAAVVTDATPTQRRQGGGGRGPFAANRPAEGVNSPDGKWVAEVRDDNVSIRRSEESASDGSALGVIRSVNGSADLPFGALTWSPDSKTLVAYRVERGAHREVTFVESSPREGGRARVHTRPYDLPGDKFDAFEMWLFATDTGAITKVEIDRVDFHGPPRLRWKEGGTRFTFEKTDRGHQRFRVVSVDARTGKVKNLIDDRSETFIDTYSSPYIHYLESADEILYKSERDGWAHLYLVDGKTGETKQITRGEWVVREVSRVDDKGREVWFRGSGKNTGQDPYLLHDYKVKLDGTGLVALTEADGNHATQLAPGGKYLIDTYSRVDMPPVHELRKVADGSLVCNLGRADVSALEETGWVAPEVFRSKARDGKTEIWGVVYRPKNLDPTKSYPIIESIYAGPHGSFVPKAFSAYHPGQALAELGFVVVQLDGMGTANRSKAFHDVCWHNVADAGLPDRILWIKALAEKYPYMDTTRVGIFGTSAGGQSSTGALLFHPDFYKVAVSSCGCHDNRMDKASWNEQWMGYPVGPHYADNSNITHAKNLRGKLLLMVGEMDTNVPPESTYRLVDALTKAGKDFDFVMLPGMDHTDGGRYGERRRRDFFVRHLLKVEPPERNETGAGPTASAIMPEIPKADRSVTLASRATPVITPPDEGRATGDLDPSHAPMRDLIERYTADANVLRRSAPAEGSSARSDRLRRFQRGWLSALESVDFAALDQTGKVDYLLLKSHAENELRELDVHDKTLAEAGPLLPFAMMILDLEAARRKMDAVDPRKAAETLAALPKLIKEARKGADEQFKGEKPKLDKAVAGRAAREARSLRSTLQDWYGFYNGYDPLFTWWAAEPYKAADRALGDYATYLRGKSGVSESDDEAIVGNPIGREALLGDLADAMIPYTPEQLVALANKEFAWCEAEMKKASQAMGYGDDWKKALEHVKGLHVEPGKQPGLIRDLTLEAIKFVDDHDLVTVPALAREVWRMDMMSPERQKFNPFFTGGEVISVAFPTNGMSHEQKMMSLRGNNAHFARATVFHEVIPGHHLQGFMAQRHKPYRRPFNTPFLVEGWSLYWETLLWDMEFPRSPEDKVGMLFWRMHRCARIIFSLGFHLGTMSPQECIDLLVDRVGHERENATAEVRRSFSGGYGPLYQAAYMLGGLQIKAMRAELVGPGKMTDRAFHDAILRENAIPIELIRASLSNRPLTRDYKTSWKFYGEVDPGKTQDK